jgi:hypothetical protein
MNIMLRRKETMSISELMNRGKETISPSELATMKKGKTAGLAFGLSTLPLAFAPAIKAKEVFAADVVPVVAKTELSNKLMDAFSPLIDLVQSLAYPVGMIVVLGGAIMVMIGQQEKGYSMLMSAGLGIILINIAPMVLNILIGAMKSVV